MHASVRATPRETIGIFAGNGSLPIELGRRIREDGRRPFVIGIEGEADLAIEEFDHRWLDWGRFGHVFDLLKEEHAERLLFVGGIKRRPDLRLRHLDWTTTKVLPSLLSMLASGDDTILSGVLKLFAEEGFELLSVPQIAPDLMLERGHAIGPRLAKTAREQVDRAADLIRTLGPFDVGQAAVVCGRRVVAIEGVEGTDAMLERVGRLRDDGRLGDRRDGVLVKVPKPGQDLRVDLPTIGPRTIMLAAAAGLTAIAGEAETTIVLDRERTADLAGRHRITIFGLDPR